MLLLRNADVEQVLDVPGAIGAMRAAYADLDRGDAAYIPRIDLFAPTGRADDYYCWGSMSGYCRTYGLVATRMKSDVVSWPDGRTQEKYCVEPGTYCGLVFLFDARNGEPLALIHDGHLQHVRVGASAGIGTDRLARPDARTVGILGSGGMARVYLEAIAAVRPLSSGRVYSPTAGHREAFAAEMGKRLGVDLVPVGTAEEAVRGADIVATATDAMSPTFDPGWLAPGAHVTCVTRRELGAELLQRADVIVQLGVNTVPAGTALPGMEWRAGGIASYVAGTPEERARIPASRRTEEGTYPTLLDVSRGDAPGRSGDEQVSLFVNTGTQGLQFAAVGGYVLHAARERGLGRSFPTDWLLQDIRD